MLRADVGNALGTWLGGLAVTAGLGYRAPLFVGAGIVLTSVIVMVVAARRAGSPAHNGLSTEGEA